tara:strand:+ start:110 stop:553 length:444 start_codon:yes stop_codon:yes gene_type:complete
MGELLKIWIKTAPGEAMLEKTKVKMIANKGIEGSATEKSHHRQVTILSIEAWNKATENLGKSVDPAERRSNFLVQGIDLNKTIGKILNIGDLQIQITGETKPCNLMEKISSGLKGALEEHWNGGATGIVVNDCSVSIGDLASWKTNK